MNAGAGERRATPPFPTSEGCSAEAEIEWVDIGGNQRKGRACWYPQMGGYVAKCVIEVSTGNNHCFEAWVWHDGSFPFGDSTVEEDAPPVAHLHHCSADQFIDFGKAVKRFSRPAKRGTQ